MQIQACGNGPLEFFLVAPLTFPSERHFFFFRNLFNLRKVVIDYLVFGRRFYRWAIL